jgi:hypothetical protein
MFLRFDPTMKLVELNERRTSGFGPNIRCFPLLFLALILSTVGLSAKQHKKHRPDAPQDQIEVVFHLPLTERTITRLLTTLHYRRDYLYAEHEAGKAVTLIDVTDIEHPSLLADVSYSDAGTARIVAVTGNAALVASNGNDPSVSAAPQTFRIMSFVDPLHPTVKQEFKGVTAITTDEKRGLFFLANSEGIWILRQTFALSPHDEERQKSILRSIYDTP